MTRFCYLTACTIDGYIADADNSLQWLFDVPQTGGDSTGGDSTGGDSTGGDSTIEDFVAEVGVLVMGSTTYRWVLKHESVLDQPQKWRDWYGDRPTFVFTHRELPSVPDSPITFVSGDVAAAGPAIRAAAGDRLVWLMGGGELVGAFDDAGMLDEIRLNIMPVTLGAGAPVLPRRITSERMSLRGVNRVGQRIDATYDVSPADSTQSGEGSSRN